MLVNELTVSEQWWLERVRFYMSQQDDLRDYGIFLQHMNVRSQNTPGYEFIAAIGMVEDQLTLFLNFTRMTAFTLATAAEIMAHEVLHPINGHCGDRGVQLFATYGKNIGGIAVDLVVNQLIKLQLLIDADLKPVSFDMEVRLKRGVFKLKDLGFEPNSTSLDYAKKLAALDWIEPPADPRFEEFDPSLNRPDCDAVVQEIVERVVETARANTNTLSPGFSSPDAQEFIAQRKGPAAIAWQQRVRRLYTASVYSRREPTPSRPSRRCAWHQGRISRQDALVWFWIDTSGSMGDPQLSVVEREIVGLRRLNARVRVMHADVRIAKEYDYTGGSVTEFCGRGGTDFSALFMKLQNTGRHERPNMIVFYTDGQGGYKAYDEHMAQKFGREWHEFKAKRPVYTFERVPLLWLIPDSSYVAKEKRFAEFGEVGVLPVGEEHAVH